MKKIGLVILGLGVLLIGIISFSKEEKKVLVEEEINNSNTSLVFMLQDKEGNYNKSEELPSSGYSFNTSKSVCSNNTTPTWEDNKLYLNNLSKNGTSCYLYFDIFSSAKNTILSNSKVNEGEPDFSKTATTDEGIYKAEDDWGESYYFRGAVENNYVKFAGYYWRIIRINGDGSVRLIYQGTSPSYGELAQIDAYNNVAEAYTTSVGVGFTYTLDAQRPNEEKEEKDSTVKEILDNWYVTNISERGLDDKITSIPGFCNDRDIANKDSWSLDDKAFYYNAWERLQTQKIPILKCNNDRDLYKVKIGLITADEVSMAGGVWNTENSSYYLHIGNSFWTMTPCRFTLSSTYKLSLVFYLGSDGSLNNNGVNASRGIRPVINLASDVTLSGTGTASDPYIVEGAE